MADQESTLGAGISTNSTDVAKIYAATELTKLIDQLSMKAEDIAQAYTTIYKAVEKAHAGQ